MVHMNYDFGLVVGSVVAALIICYLAISIEQLLFKNARQQHEKLILIISGAILGAAIWSMHFIGMQACHLPKPYHFDYGLTGVSYLIAFAASTFAIWLTSRETLPLARLVLGAVLMGLGISGMHYTGMMGLMLEHYSIEYSPLIVIFSILIAICGAGLTFWLLFKFKNAFQRVIPLKIAIAFMMTLSIVGMHYTGMVAVTFHPLSNDVVHQQMDMSQGLILITVLFIASVILVAAFSVAVLEQRLEERNKQLSKANRELANQAVQDNLTKLPNRLYLAEYAHVLFTDQRYRQDKIAFLYIDLDRFKAVNDAFGHHVGDQLLIQLANRMHRLLPKEGTLLRIGGDEFLMVIERATSQEAIEYADRIIHTVQDSFVIAGKEINISGSVGIAMYPEHGTSLQDLLINADAAMLTSKYQGRNTYSLFSFNMDQHESQSQTKLINDLYKAVEVQQFLLFYQPKFKAKDRSLCGVEALIRWNHPQLGLLSPNMFIKGAEKTGLIIQMGYWALEQACKQIQKWQHTQPEFFPVAVNLSAVQFEHKHLFSTLERLFTQYQINPNHLMIEITETTAMHHIDSSIRSFEKLRQMGIRLAIDDFGTGHSSFLYLKNLAVDELKIDREFIKNLKVGSKEEMILESIIQLAMKLDLLVTAEGVETEEQAEILTRLGCEQLQGFLLGLPVDDSRLENLQFH
jgi:diguanylate cyclase